MISVLPVILITMALAVPISVVHVMIDLDTTPAPSLEKLSVYLDGEEIIVKNVSIHDFLI